MHASTLSLSHIPKEDRRNGSVLGSQRNIPEAGFGITTYLWGWHKEIQGICGDGGGSPKSLEGRKIFGQFNWKKYKNPKCLDVGRKGRKQRGVCTLCGCPHWNHLVVGFPLPITYMGEGVMPSNINAYFQQIKKNSYLRILKQSWLHFLYLKVSSSHVKMRDHFI